MKYNKGLDTFRAFAVLFVIIQHWGTPFNSKGAIGRFVYTFFIPDGGTGVYMFFVLSGFLITSILLNARKNANDANRGLIAKNFFIRRILRIFPVYYLILFILLAVNYHPDLKENFWYFVTYTSNILYYRANFLGTFSQTWTLAVEEQFYLLWPWFILFINRKYLKYVFIVAAIIGITTTYWEVVVNDRIIPYLAFNCLDAFAFGGFYAYARINSTYCKKFEKIVMIAAPAVLLMFILRKVAIYNGNDYYLVSVKKSVDSFLSLWVIILICNNKSIIVKKYLLENRALNLIGKVSYCMYLIHGFILLYNDQIKLFINTIVFHNQTPGRIFTGTFFMFCIDLLIVVGIAWLSYVCIERPIMSFKKAFKYN